MSPLAHFLKCGHCYTNAFCIKAFMHHATTECHFFQVPYIVCRHVFGGLFFYTAIYFHLNAKNKCCIDSNMCRKLYIVLYYHYGILDHWDLILVAAGEWVACCCCRNSKLWIAAKPIQIPHHDYYLPPSEKNNFFPILLWNRKQTNNLVSYG